MGIDTGDSLTDLDAGWIHVSDLLARHEREKRILDEPAARELEAEFAAKGMTQVPEKDPIVEAIRSTASRAQAGV